MNAFIFFGYKICNHCRILTKSGVLTLRKKTKGIDTRRRCRCFDRNRLYKESMPISLGFSPISIKEVLAMLESTTDKKRWIGIVANLIALGFCLALELVTATNLYNSQIYIFILAVLAYSVLLLLPMRQHVLHDVLSFFIAVSLLRYLYLNTPGEMAMVLFYLYAVQIGLQYEQRRSLILSIIIATIYAATNINWLEGTQYHILSTSMHTILIVNLNILTQHLSHLERNARWQNEKVEQLLFQLEKSYQAVSTLAEKDELTTLYNYRSFRNKLMEIRSDNIAILLIDIDYFKNFNDTYGHLCGDAVLRDMAEILKKSLRETDMVFRYGGEEFAAIIRCGDEVEVQAAAMRISNNVETTPFHFGKEAALRVTVSIGYAISGDKIQTSEELFKVADDALYNAKKSGRNLIGCPNGDICTPTSVYVSTTS